MPGRDADHHPPYVDPHAKEDERTYALFTHLVGLLSLADMTLLGLIGTIIMWRIKAKQSPFLDDHGREAVNFQLSLLIYTIGGAIVLGAFTLLTFFVGSIITIPAAVIGAIFVVVLRLVGGIRGAIFAARGQYYRYPMTLRLIPEPVE
ncbi:MAG: DUF4870 domain-containing protein [Phycisphaerales bacterium]|nr:DUF4870 domain-containing protein [Phycisphaerales bacterium]